jgi:serine/threonine-protein kinase
MVSSVKEPAPVTLDTRIVELLERVEARRDEGNTLTEASVKELCRDCPELATEVWRRFQELQGFTPPAVGQLTDTTVTPGAAPVEPDWESPGTLLGRTERFEPLRHYARGGLGEVFLARDAELGRTVAVKRILRFNQCDLRQRQEFLREAEITGLLEHPGVVPVYGLVHDGQGEPCYAMRLVQGETLREAIDRFLQGFKHRRDYQSGAFRQLLQRFIAVCNTLAYAHSRGVIHRDLKPNNIILGKYGETVVLDWGLAKQVERDEAARAGGEETVRPSSSDSLHKTERGSTKGTPAYMSPEQALGQWDIVGPASDVFSLGATLYNLLTNSSPYKSTWSPDVIAEASIGEIISPRQRKKEVPVALEAICLKAMARKREERYATALELAADLEHWLADEPVSVYCEPWPQRLGRWARRHRGLAASSVAGVAVAAICLAVVSLLMGRKNAELAAANTREQAAADLARRTIEDMTSEDALLFLETQKELRPEQRHFLEQAVAYYQEAVGQEESEQDDQWQHARAYLRMGNLQRRLGLNTEAEATYRAALERYQCLVAEHPQVAEYRQNLGRNHNNLGILLTDLGNRPEAENQFRAALVQFEGLAAEYPEVPAYHQDVAEGHSNFGNLLKSLGKWADGEKEYRAALAEQERLASEYPSVPEYRQKLARSHNNLALLLAELGKRREAEKEYIAAVVEFENLAVDHPQVADYRRALAVSHNNLGHLLAGLGKPPEAEKEYRAALVEQHRLVADHPQVPNYRQELAGTHNNLGILLANLGKQPEAEKEYQAAIAEQERLTAEHPQVPMYHVELAKSHNNLGGLLGDMGKWIESQKEFNAALVEQEKLTAQHPLMPEYRRDLAMSHNNFGILLTNLGKWPEAERQFEAALTQRGLLVTEHPQMPAYAVDLGISYCDFGTLLRERGQPAAALDWYGKAIATLKHALTKLGADVAGRRYLRNSHWGRAQALAMLDRYTEAIRDWDSSITLDDGSGGSEIRAARAKTLMKAGEIARANADAEELLEAGSLNGDTLYDISCLFSLTSAKTKEPAEAERYAGRAMTVLRQAIGKGYGDIEHMKKDKDLDALRERSNFKKLLAELEAKAKPVGK